MKLSSVLIFLLLMLCSCVVSAITAVIVCILMHVPIPVNPSVHPIEVPAVVSVKPEPPPFLVGDTVFVSDAGHSVPAAFHVSDARSLIDALAAKERGSEAMLERLKQTDKVRMFAPGREGMIMQIVGQAVCVELTEGSNSGESFWFVDSMVSKR
jgi:hypothetical protein